jgi:lauroyl/myristoyl acyltransferase
MTSTTGSKASRKARPVDDQHRSGDRRPRFGREPRREIRYSLSIRMALLSSWAVSMMPGWFRHWLSDRIADAFFRLSTTYRRNVMENIGQVVGTQADARRTEAMARLAFRLSARNFTNLMRTPRIPHREFLTNVTLAHGSWQTLDEIVEKKQGGIFVTGHVGAFDYIGQTLHARGYKLTTVTGRTTSRFIYDGVAYLRRSRGAGIVEATPSGIRQVIQALRRGEFAAFLTDRDFFQNGKPVAFFGRATTLPPGAVRIARDTGAPIIPIFARYIKGGYAISIHEPFYVERTDDMETDIAIGLAKIVTILERAIGDTPEQWVMFQRVWPSAPADPVRVFPVGSPLESELLEKVAAALPEPRAARPHRSGSAPTDHTERRFRFLR